MFDLIVYLYVPSVIRMQRLQDREIDRYGPAIEDPNDPRYNTHKDFLEWAAAYDSGGPDMRSKAMHEKWLSKLETTFLRIEGTPSITESTMRVLDKAATIHLKKIFIYIVVYLMLLNPDQVLLLQRMNTGYEDGK